MADEITNNFIFLTKNLTGLQEVLVHCVQNKIISTDECERIIAGETSLDRNVRFFNEMNKKDWKNIKPLIVTILRETLNEQCANKLEGEVPPPHKKSKESMLILPIRKGKNIFDPKWWPEVKRLPLVFLERKTENIKLVDILKENLTNSKNKSTVINQETAVSGMGGVGKTTVAKWFAVQFQDSYDHIIWIDCGEENLSTSFTDLAKKLKIDTTLRLNSLARECFSKLEEAKCLFIFDNAECYQGHQGIRDVLPKHNNFHTIITSRTKMWGSSSGDGKIRELHLTVFPLNESVEFLMKNLEGRMYTEDKLKELSELLGNLPLALQISVTTINTKKLSINEYIERIKQTDNIINVKFDDYEKTINKTMKISLDIIKNHEEDPKQTAHKILLIFGYIKPDMVDIKLFQAIENFPEIETKEAIELLEKYCLVTTEVLGHCSVHRLLQQVIRHNTKEDSKITLKKILSVKGFLDYKLLPYLYADEETQSLFPQVRAQLIDQSNLEKFLEHRRFGEALELSRMIKDTLKTPMAEYNYALCLEKMDKLAEATTILKTLLNDLSIDGRNNKSEDIEEYLSFRDQLNLAIGKVGRNISENGVWNLAVQIGRELVSGLLFLVYNKLELKDAANEIINQDCKLLAIKSHQNLDNVIKYLKSPSIGNYQLENGDKFIFLKLGNNYGKIISLENCSLSEDFPNNLNHLSLMSKC